MKSTYLSVCQYDTGIPVLHLCIYLFLYGTDDTISTMTVATLGRRVNPAGGH
jgi:hypothetical protein